MMFRLCNDINFQTPHFVCKYMASLLPWNKLETILEPTPGIGNLVTAVQERYPDAVITTPEDYFVQDFNKRYDAVIMNPPFTSKSADLQNAPRDAIKMGMRLGYYMLLQCMDMADIVVALMPWFTISDSDIRLKSLVSYGLKAVTPLPRKTFRYARIQTCVIELEKGYKGGTSFKTEFHRGDNE